MVSTSQIISFRQQEKRIRCKNKFTLGGKKFLTAKSTNGKKWKKVGFHWPENSCLLARMKVCFKNTFPMSEK